MNQACFICDTQFGATARNAIDIFSESVSLSDNSPLVSTILSDALGTTVSRESVHSNVICRKCAKLCSDYHSKNEKLKEIRSDLQRKLKDTLVKQNTDMNKQIPMEVTIKEEPVGISNKPMAKLVLPVSKLHPLPANYVLNMEHLNVNQNKAGVPVSGYQPLKTMKTLTPIKIKPKPTSPATIVIPSKTDTMSLNNVDKPDPCRKTNISNALPNLLNRKKPQVLLSDINKLPQNMLASYKSHATPIEETSPLGNADDHEHSMEIDEDCTFVGLPATDSNLIIDESFTDSGKSTSVTVDPLHNVDNVLIESKIENTQDTEDEEEQTIVMQDENGSILQMMSGKKLVYSGGELTLMMQSVNEDGQDNNDDGIDSNDDCQIELQVSGDEETAKAIIAAASQQGGAFIKVESGEMFRVKSVKSKSKTELEDDKDTTPIVDMVKEENGQFTCLLCQNIVNVSGGMDSTLFGTAEDMMSHLKSKHNARLYICAVCNAIFRRKADLAKHYQTHNLSKMHENRNAIACSICKKKYNSKTLLREHMNTHTGKRPYSCSVCDKTFASKYTHQAHLKTHADRPRPFKCSKCPKAFLNQPNLTQHEKTHLGIKDFVCNVCNKAFGSQHNLEVHRVVHAPTKPYSCDHCGKAFARRNEVQDHMRTHTGERPFSCEICGAAFTQRSNLHSHRKATHFNEARHHCQLCPKKFKRRRLLEYHIKSSHTGERPLICDICQSTFVYPEHFRKHKRIHSGEKPYDCEVCGKTFNSRDNRNMHRFVHSDKKPYECLVCGTGYMRKQLLYAHMNTSGHLAESIVVNQPRVHKVRTGDKASSSPSNTEKSEDDQPIILDTSEFDEIGGDGNKTDDDGEEATKVYVTNSDSEQKYVLQEEKSASNLEVEGAENTLFNFLNNLDDNNSKSEEPFSQMVITSEQFTTSPKQVQLVSSVSDRSNVRVVQVKMPNGGMGWVALAGDHPNVSSS